MIEVNYNSLEKIHGQINSKLYKMYSAYLYLGSGHSL